MDDLVLENVSKPVIGGYDGDDVDARNFLALPGLNNARELTPPPASHVPPAWAKELMAFLDATPLESLEKELGQGDVVWLKTTSTIGDALFFFRKYGHISGAPVFKGGECWGMLELFDVMTVLVRAPRPSFWALLSGTRPEVSPLDLTLEAVIDFAGRPSCFLINTSFFADSLVEAFRSQWRVGLYSHSRLVAVVSQTGLARALAGHGGKLCDKTTLEAAGLIVAPVLSCAAEDRAGLVMAAMVRRRVNAVAVLREGRLSGCLSTRALLGLRDPEDLSLSAGDLLSMAKDAEPLLTCGPRDSVADLLKQFGSGRSHRVWIVEKKRLVGVVTLSSLFRCMYDGAATKKPGAERLDPVSVL
jgi:CBS domain-containing protein